MDLALRALNRFGLGARRDERRGISDPKAWLKAQLDGGDTPMESRDSVPSTAVASPAAIADALRALRMPGPGDEPERREARRSLVELAAGEARAALDRLLGELAQGLLAFRAEMGPAWRTTTVVVMTEFGRTVRPNGTRGTDHGTAGAGFVLGPRLSRSRVVSDWPGLGQNALYEARDLRPTLDTRSILKAALAGTFDMTNAQLERVFPNSAGVRASAGLMT